jgi:hypothetical protein
MTHHRSRDLSDNLRGWDNPATREALAAHDSLGYETALKALGDGAERNTQIVEGLDECESHRGSEPWRVLRPGPQETRGEARILRYLPQRRAALWYADAIKRELIPLLRSLLYRASAWPSPCHHALCRPATVWLRKPRLH